MLGVKEPTYIVNCHLCEKDYEVRESQVQEAPMQVAQGLVGGIWKETCFFFECPTPDCGCWLPIWKDNATR